MPDTKTINNKFRGYDKGPPLRSKEYLYGWYPTKKDVYKQSQEKYSSYDLECLYKHGKSRYIDNNQGRRTPKLQKDGWDTKSRTSDTSGSVAKSIKKKASVKKKHPYVVVYDTPVPGEKLRVHKFDDDKDDDRSKGNRESQTGVSNMDKYSTIPMPPTHKGRSTIHNLEAASVHSPSKSRCIPHKIWSTCVSETDFKVLDYVQELDQNTIASETMLKVQDLDAMSEVASVRSFRSMKSGLSTTSSVIRKLADGRYTQMSRQEAKTPSVHTGRVSNVPEASNRISTYAGPTVLASEAEKCEDAKLLSPTPVSIERYSPARGINTMKPPSRQSTFSNDFENFDTGPEMMKHGFLDSLSESSCPRSSVDSTKETSRPSTLRNKGSTMGVNQYTAYQAMYNPVLHTLKWKVGGQSRKH